MMPELLCLAISMRKNLGRVSSTALSSETRPLYRVYLQSQERFRQTSVLRKPHMHIEERLLCFRLLFGVVTAHHSRSELYAVGQAADPYEPCTYRYCCHRKQRPHWMSCNTVNWVRLIVTPHETVFKESHSARQRKEVSTITPLGRPCVPDVLMRHGQGLKV